MGKPVVASRLPMVRPRSRAGTVSTYEPGDARRDGPTRSRTSPTNRWLEEASVADRGHRPQAAWEREATGYLAIVDPPDRARAATARPADVARVVGVTADRALGYHTPRPSLPPACRAGHATGPQSPHDLSSQTRRQTRPPPVVGRPGPAELLPQHRLRPWSSSAVVDPRRRRRADLVQRPPRAGRRASTARPSPGRLQGAADRSRPGGSRRPGAGSDRHRGRPVTDRGPGTQTPAADPRQQQQSRSASVSHSSA